MDSGYPCGAVGDGEAQGFHAHKPVGVGAFGAGRFGGGKIGVELKADSEIVGQNGQLLPCTIGGVMVGGNSVEREFSLELGKGLFLRPAASNEVPQWARAEREVSRCLAGQWPLNRLDHDRGPELREAVQPRPAAHRRTTASGLAEGPAFVKNTPTRMIQRSFIDSA